MAAFLTKLQQETGNNPCLKASLSFDQYLAEKFVIKGTKE
jgi:hypothetical protein